MRSGNLDMQIHLQRAGAGAARLGEYIPDQWTTIPGGEGVWAKYKPRAGSKRSEDFQQGERLSETLAEFEIRGAPELAVLDAQHSLLEVESGRRWDILDATGFGQRHRAGIRILAKSRAD